MGRFNGGRLRLARHLYGLTQRELGRRVAVSHPMIAMYENGDREPKADVTEALAVVLKVRPSFFYGDSGDEFPIDALNFRDQISASDALRRQVIAFANLYAMVIRVIAKRVNVPALKLPSISVNNAHDPEGAALTARQEWGIPADAPVGRMSRVLENAGIVITTLRLESESANKVDALSAFGDIGIVLLNRAKESTTRTRFDMAHELGHGIMHRSKPRQLLPAKEAEAHAFAGAFLLPREAFTRDFMLLGKSIDGLLELKQKWKVSLQAMLMRARELGLLDAAEVRVWFQRISKRGWRQIEPGEPPVASEAPEIIPQALSLIGPEPAETLMAELDWTPELIEMVTGLTPRPAPESDVVSLSTWREEKGKTGEQTVA